MNLRRLLRLAIDLQSIPAPTFREERRAAALQAALCQAGLTEVSRDQVGNVLARVPGGERGTVVLAAHIDSVFPPDLNRRARRRGDRILGPGIGDNAVALAALVELARDLSRRPAPGEVWLVGTVGEEGLGNLRGMRAVVDRFGDAPCAYLALEGMALGRIYHRGLPVRRLRLTARGPGGHSWIHAGRPSAVHALIRFADRLLDLPLPESPRTSLNIGRIQGGTSVNTLAPEAWIELDLRSEDQAALDRLTRAASDLLRSMPLAGVRWELKVVGDRAGGSLAPDHALVRTALAVYEQHLGSPPALESASTDANYPLSLGLPALCVGLTYGGGAHSQEEYIEIPPIRAGYRALAALVRAACRLG